MLSAALSNATYDWQDIVAAYNVLGFNIDAESKDVMLFDYTENKEDAFEPFSIASKNLNEEYKIMIIALRGTVTGDELWGADFKFFGAGDEEMKSVNMYMDAGIHTGFFSYAVKVRSGLYDYLIANPEVNEALENNKCKVLILGHSLGSAGGTVLGAYLDNYDMMEKSHLFVYGIGSPKTIISGNKSIYGNIWNYVIDEDLVPVAGFNWFGNMWKYDYSDITQLPSSDYHMPPMYYQMIRDCYPIEIITP